MVVQAESNRRQAGHAVPRRLCQQPVLLPLARQ